MVIPAVLSEVIPPSPVALRRTSHSAVIASEAKQSIAPSKERMDCFVARAPRNDGGELCIQFSDLSKDVKLTQQPPIAYKFELTYRSSPY